MAESASVQRLTRQLSRVLTRGSRLAAAITVLGLAAAAALPAGPALAVGPVQPGGARAAATHPAGKVPPAAGAPIGLRTAGQGASVTPMTDISSGCGSDNAEVEEATGAPQYAYATWIGCAGIGFARSTDGGLHFSPPVTVPGSAGNSWDPAVAVAPDGTVYVAYMIATGRFFKPGTRMYPVVAVSYDHGASFSRITPIPSPAAGNWGDRVFIAAGPAGTVYVTWDYGPSASEVKLLCAPGGSCAYANGDFNAVIQKSTDGGKTWGPITPMEPGFPLGGGYGAPLLVRPTGRVDSLYWGHATDPGTLAVHPGYEFFTSSAGGTRGPAHPQRLWPGQGSIALPVWWIDGDLAADAAGNLYATWDTQTAQGDIGWLTWSWDGGRHWSRPVRVTPDTDSAPHVVEVAGGAPGVAYVGWQTSAPAAGYATYLRPYSVLRGWLGPAIQVSSQYGNASVWPGDTFGLSVLPGLRTRVALTWGSAIGSSKHSQIYASDVIFPPGQ